MSSIMTGRRAGVLAALTLAALASAGCAPEPGGARSTVEASATEAAGPTLTASAAPAPTTDRFALPGECRQMYSAGMLADLERTLPPLNDPAVTLYATQVPAALDVLQSGVPTIRCTWGSAGGAGLATAVSVVEGDQATRVHDALVEAGFECADGLGGIVCRTQTETVTMEDAIVSLGESHVLRDGGWVATSWVGALPEGYTEDVVGTLWG